MEPGPRAHPRGVVPGEGAGRAEGDTLSAHGLFLAWAGLLVAWALVDAGLAALNLRHVLARAGTVPAAFAGSIDPASYRRSVAYAVARGSFGMAAGGVSAAALCAIAGTGVLGALEGLVDRAGLSPSLGGAAFVGLAALGAWVLRVPFSLWSTFVIEERFGFNRTTPRLFAADTLKGLALAAALGAPLLLLLFLLVDRAGDAWWAYAFAGYAVVELGLAAAGPLVIAPLFNRFTPLPVGPLRTGVLALAASTGLRAHGVFVVDASRRSRHSGAYVTGLGRGKRIVLYDTLVAASPQEEVLAVLAHEIGHERRGHVPKAIAASLAVSLAGFALLGALLRWEPLFDAFGFARPSAPALVVLVAFFSGPVVFFLQPFAAWWSRRHEYEADAFAVRATGSGAGLRAALLRLSRDNLSTLVPHPLYSAFHHTHPTLAERLAAIGRAEAGLAQGPGAGRPGR